MTVTSSITQNNQPTRIAQGRFMDTVELTDAIDFSLGFTPRYVRILNEDGVFLFEWFEGMADGRGLRSTGSLVFVAAPGGVTPRGLVVTDTFRGFTVGLASQIIGDNQQISWYAHD